MTLNEAIKILQKDIDDPGSVAIEDVNRAEGLGIEALKRVQLQRKIWGMEQDAYLPGETEE